MAKEARRLKGKGVQKIEKDANFFLQLIRKPLGDVIESGAGPKFRAHRPQQSCGAGSSRVINIA